MKYPLFSIVSMQQCYRFMGFPEPGNTAEDSLNSMDQDGHDGGTGCKSQCVRRH
jgi:hypothetical protein